MKRITILFFLLNSFLSTHENVIRVMTYNIRYAGDENSEGENAWSRRKEMVAKMIRFNNADIIGVQEALKIQLDDLQKLLPDLKWTGAGRDDGKDKGEFSAILFNKNKFELLTGSTFWLSETPDSVSMGWDAACNRVVTWAKFKYKISGKIFFVFNTHFDHMGVIARRESAKLITKKINEIISSFPVIITGDFNCTINSEPYEIIKNNFYDTEFAAKFGNYGTDFTFNNFGKEKEKNKIDFIFAKNNLDVIQHGIDGETFNGQYPSDHMPVIADFIMK